ncbi:matrix metalloproteinase-2 [Galendromus occidentalis]|uniref:Matrix metalloproteinase-2 n=1 Tax=Galendromus occidentalis TaxID=34638 RepID=A0AAJ7WIF7_9ACAR|nr:matrix metalloproteinase-2 [Galendromus occidentalis]
MWPSAGFAVIFTTLGLSLELTVKMCAGAPTLPPQPSSENGKDSSAPKKIKEFLDQFGYTKEELTARSSVAYLESSEDPLASAIRRLQSFAGIPVTGEVDNETLDLMRKPRCGVKDIDWSREGVRKKRYLIHGDPWPRTNLTYSISDWPTNLDANFIRSKLGRAIRVWSKHSKLVFTETRDPNADIVIKFLRGRHGDAYPFDGPGMVLAHAYFPGTEIGGDVHFDADENWGSKMATTGVELFVAAAHEFGHSLGLAHVQEPSSLMYPWYQQFTEDTFQLPEDDVRGIQRLYGRPDRPDYKPRFFVTTRRPFFTTSTSRRPDVFLSPQEQPPDPCQMDSIDSISMIRGETFIFKGKYFFRLDNELQIMGSHAFEISRLFGGFPTVSNNGAEVRVDAVYESRRGEINFFIGREIYVYNGQNLMPGYPKPLSSIGIPDSVMQIDAAFIWGYNQKIYLFHNDQYWRYNEQERMVEADYPRHIQMWGGVPPRIDAAFTWTDQSTYFFKSRSFWRFHNRRLTVFNDSGSIAQFWFGCQNSSPSSTFISPLHTFSALLLIVFYNQFLFESRLFRSTSEAL